MSSSVDVDVDAAATAARPTKRQRMEHLIQRGTRLADEQEQGALEALGTEREHASSRCSSTRRTSWTAAEDAKLRALVQQHGSSNWSEIATHLPKRDRKRCRERFVNHLAPSLTSSRPWSQQEQQKLTQLHRRLGCQWAKMAQQMAGRSPEEVKNRCIALARRNEEGEMEGQRARASPQYWTSTERERLRSLVQQHGAQNWLFIASQLPGRTDLQCLQHWYRTLDETVVKGKGTWTASEDAVLLAKAVELGRKWTNVAAFLPGRIGKQCRERFLNHLDPLINKTPWTVAEEEILIQTHAKYPNRWSLIAKELTGRGENAIKNHWHKLRRCELLPTDPIASSKALTSDAEQ